MINIQKIKTLGELKPRLSTQKYQRRDTPKSYLQLKRTETTFPGIVGYEDSVIPDVERALLSKHNILFLGLERTGLKQGWPGK
jgi:magnesium chelatase subunit I